MKNLFLYICSCSLLDVVKRYKSPQRKGQFWLHLCPLNNSINCNQQESQVKATLLNTYGWEVRYGWEQLLDMFAQDYFPGLWPCLRFYVQIKFKYPFRVTFFKNFSIVFFHIKTVCKVTLIPEKFSTITIVFHHHIWE